MQEGSLVDTVEKAEVAEIERATFRVLQSCKDTVELVNALNSHAPTYKLSCTGKLSYIGPSQPWATRCTRRS